MTCILLNQRQDLGLITCEAKDRNSYHKQRNPLIITPHCWRYND